MRVTSEVSALSCFIIVLTMVADCRNSPLSGRPSTLESDGLREIPSGDGGDDSGDRRGRP